MKKAFKLVWMVLFALPLISLTACGDDDEPDGSISFRDYSNLINEDRNDILNKKMKDYTPYYEDLFGVYYAAYDEETDLANSLGDNISEVDAYFTFFEERTDNPDLYVTYEDCVMVDVELYGFQEWEVANYLSNKYGKSTQMANGLARYEKDGKYIFLDNEDGIFVTYVDKKKYDGAFDTKATEFDIKAGLKAARARK